MAGENLVYPGRFQPMTIGHLACANDIYERYQPKRMIMVFPENKYRSQENPFLAPETKRIIELSFEGRFPIEIMGINMEANLYELWRKYLGQFQVDLVASGNKKMVGIVNRISLGATRAVCFGDGNISQIRASDLREKMKKGDFEWKKMMVPVAAEYVEGLAINWQELPKMRKRWYE